MDSNLPRLPIYKYLTGIQQKPSETYLGLRNMLSNFAMFLLKDKQDNGEDYTPNTKMT